MLRRSAHFWAETIKAVVASTPPLRLGTETALDTRTSLYCYFAHSAIGGVMVPLNDIIMWRAISIFPENVHILKVDQKMLTFRNLEFSDFFFGEGSYSRAAPRSSRGIETAGRPAATKGVRFQAALAAKHSEGAAHGPASARAAQGPFGQCATTPFRGRTPASAGNLVFKTSFFN